MCSAQEPTDLPWYCPWLTGPRKGLFKLLKFTTRKVFDLDTRTLGGPGSEETYLLIPLISVRPPTHILLQGPLPALLKSLPESLPESAWKEEIG